MVIFGKILSLSKAVKWHFLKKNFVLKSVNANYSMKSLDPRVNRLPGWGTGEVKPKSPLDQWGTFEVFVQAKEGKPFQHEGIVHAPDTEMAYLLAKETFTRRFTCTSLYVADTRDVYVSPMTEGDVSAYDMLPPVETRFDEKETYEIYTLSKRGKQHVHAGSVQASSPQEAMALSKEKHNTGKSILNIWAIPAKVIRFTTDEEKDLWLTLAEKKYRDASAYKAGDKLTAFLTKEKSQA
jgi:ring-1,2-phenylacetyl-CoA epoxidase subunit PaaB